MKKLTKVLLAVGVVMAAGAAVAGNGGSAFNNVHTELAGWLNGAPGKAIAVLAFGLAMFNVVKQNFVAAGGSFVGCLLMANASTIIDGFLTAGI